MAQLTDAEEIELLIELYPETTKRIIKWFTLMMQELDIVQKVDTSADMAKKAWDVAQRIDRRQQQRTQADVRAWAAHLATLKANTQDAEE